MIDHLVYAVPDLAAACDRLERDLGVRPSAGGKHLVRGTHNALLDLEEGRYLEVIAPDPEQPRPGAPRPFGIDDLTGSRLVTWAAKAADIEDRASRSRALGYDPGEVLPMTRLTPEGRELRWRLTRRNAPAGDGLVPFLIDWGASPHPSATAARGCRLIDLRAEHPRPELVEPMLAALGVQLDLHAGPAPRLVATIAAPRGQVQLS